MVAPKKNLKLTKKGLQKFTDIDEANRILSLDKLLTPEDTAHLNDQGRKALQAAITEKLQILKDVQLDQFIVKIDGIIPSGFKVSFKNQLWEINHEKISWSISVLMQDLGRMPTKNEIAEKAGLSRVTIGKHLRDYKNDPQFKNYVQQYKIIATRLLAKVYCHAVNGDMRAARLYLEMAGNLSETTAASGFTQNNFIQINQLKVTQEELKRLKPEQLQTLEDLFKPVVASS